MGSNMVWDKEEEKWYKSLVCSFIKWLRCYRRISIRSMGYFSGEIEYALRALCSGPIQTHNQDTQQYTRYTFLLGIFLHHLMVNWYAIIVLLEKPLRKFCQNWYKLDNKMICNKSNTATILSARPKKARQNIEMMAENLHLVQNSNLYLWSRLEEQRDKHGDE